MSDNMVWITRYTMIYIHYVSPVTVSPVTTEKVTGLTYLVTGLTYIDIKLMVNHHI